MFQAGGAPAPLLLSERQRPAAASRKRRADLMPLAGLEPARPHGHLILSQ
jgi:hypothetical protein